MNGPKKVNTSEKKCFLVRKYKKIMDWFMTDITNLASKISTFDYKHERIQRELSEERQHIDALRELIERIDEYRISRNNNNDRRDKR